MMGKFVDLTGWTFGKWKVIKRAVTNKSSAYWEYVCECGTQRLIRSAQLTKANSDKCCIKCTNRTHSHMSDGKPSKTYYSWRAMKYRCLNPKSHNYKWYGGAGIKVCKSWLIFTNFLKDMGERPFNTSKDRINPNGNYEPGNCRWANPRIQANNKKSKFKINGVHI